MFFALLHRLHHLHHLGASHAHLYWRALATTAGACALVGLTVGLSGCGLGQIGQSQNTGPTATTGPTVLYQNALTSAADNWTNDQNCFFGAGGYHINGGFLCVAPAGTLTDVDVSVQVKQISGETTIPYGIGFRRPSTGNRYEFDIDSNSKWVFFKCAASNCTTVIDYTADAAIQGGLNTVNTLEVRAVGSQFEFLVNGTKVGQTTDTTYPSGEVGLAGDDGIEVVFSNLKIIKPA